MCGDHHHQPGAVSTDPQAKKPIFRPTVNHPGLLSRARAVTRSRRAFLGDFGRGTLALAVLTPTLAACASDDEGEPGAGDGTRTDPTDQQSGSTQADQPDDGEPGDGTDLVWARANLGFVSAYVLARGNTAAIVDTGVDGSADAIGESLVSLGLTYDDVDHVILTHKHGDHAGSIAAVIERAAGATIYAGQADLEAIAALDGSDPDQTVGLTGGEDVFGLEMLATPGHTDGHMAVIDHNAGLLVAGDAIFTEDGGVIEGPEQFFDDIPTSRQTIKDLANLSFNTLLVGHGEPIEAAADTAVAALAASLP